MAAERTLDASVAALPDGQREIAEAVRHLVRSAAPEAREGVQVDPAGLRVLRSFRAARLDDEAEILLSQGFGGLPALLAIRLLYPNATDVADRVVVPHVGEPGQREP